jgi:hypothetical protein
MSESCHLRDTARRKHPEIWTKQLVSSLYDNLSAHQSLMIRKYLAKHDAWFCSIHHIPQTYHRLAVPLYTTQVTIRTDRRIGK